MKTIGASLLILLLATPAFALQGTYTWTLPTDASRTGVRVEKRVGPTTSPWVAQGAVLAAGATSFSQAGVNLGEQVCYRAITISAIADGDPNIETCATPGKPMSAGSGTLLITP
jgi:hypothetical protein